VVHRLFSATIRAPKLPADRLLALIAADPKVIAPSEVLRFEKVRGEPGRLREADELLIRMARPWKGPVKVTRRWDEGFQLTATRGHPQLGQVEIRLRDERGGIAMEIRTRERAAGISFHALQRIGVIRGCSPTRGRRCLRTRRSWAADVGPTGSQSGPGKGGTP
jgi:hypothetical protein